MGGGLCPTTSSTVTPARKHSQKELKLAEYEEGEVLCPHCSSDNVEQSWSAFYAGLLEADLSRRSLDPQSLRRPAVAPFPSLIGDDGAIAAVRQTLWERGFHPEVFKKIKGQAKSKGVDIALSKDLLSHVFFNNYEVALLISGDGDYVPLINEVKRLGKVVYVLAFSQSGLSSELKLASDAYFEMEPLFYDCWKGYAARFASLVPPPP